MKENKFDLGEELLKLQPLWEDRDNGKQDSETDKDTHYFYDDAGYLCRRKQTKDGCVPVRLANFEAWIIDEIVEDNGVDITYSYRIEGKIRNKPLSKIEIPAGSFSSMNWLYKWGNQIILEPGHPIKDYVRHSIQINSNNTQKIIHYTHTGWREINGNWAYLNGNGAIGADNVLVKLPRELQRYSLPLKPDNEIEAIKTSLSFLDIGKKEITFPLFSLLYLAPLTTILEPMPNFSGYLYGETGSLKSTLAILLLSHFGHFQSITNLSNFDDTANHLEKRAFTLKDVLMVLDDFHLSIRKGDSMYKESLAQRIIRAYSNRTGRGRLNSDTSDKGRYEPRGMLLITGEELVSLKSTLARTLIIEIEKGSLEMERLSGLQAKTSMLPHAMSSFILWVKNNMQNVMQIFHKNFTQLRDKAYKEGDHRKLPEQAAFMQFALETVLSWACDKGVFEETKTHQMKKEGWETFIKLSDTQALRLEMEDPIKRFQAILHVLIAQNKVRLESKALSVANNDLIGGWDGELIGYYDDFYFYLIPEALWHTLQRFCISEGTHFPASRHTLYKMLRDKGLIETNNNRNTISERIQGKIKRVLKISRAGIYEKEVTEVTDNV